MMLNMIKLYSLILVWLTLVFIQGHMVMEKLEFVVKLHKATQMLVRVDYVQEISVKKSCRYSKYGSFEYLLFLLSSHPGHFHMLDVFLCLTFTHQGHEHQDLHG